MGEKYHVVTLVGDGAATGGMVYEGLNDASVSNEPMIVILNDNALSIDHNVGGLASHLSKLRTKEKYLGMKKKYRGFMSRIPGGRTIFRITRAIKDRVRRMLIPTTIFESMGFSYLGPVDGHDVEHLIYLLRIAKETKRPILLHVMTQKGKGYAPAEEHPKLFHGVGTFDPVTGEVPQKNAFTFSDAFGQTLCSLAAEDPRICAITAAMPGGTGLLEFKKQYPQRLFDVGIAEEHAVSMAAGLAKQGMVPVVALYSTFLQRAYDMILQDICLQRLHVVLAVDRAGLVGEDGETHHGVFDVGFLRHAPGMTVLCPASTAEAEKMLVWAVKEYDGPVAVRYPRGGNGSFDGCLWTPDTDAVCHKGGEGVAILTYGTLVENALSAADKLQEKGIRPKVLRLTKVSPIPAETLRSLLAGCSHCVIVEEACESSGIGEAAAAMLQDACRFTRLHLGTGFTTHGKIPQLHKLCGLDANAIAECVQEVLKHEN